MRQAAPAHGAETHGPSVTRPGGWGRIFLQSGESRPESSKRRTTQKQARWCGCAAPASLPKTIASRGIPAISVTITREPSPAYLKDLAEREAEKQRAMDKFNCQLQYAHMESTERDPFCGMTQGNPQHGLPMPRSTDCRSAGDAV
jgi:hypothetical protein